MRWHWYNFLLGCLILRMWLAAWIFMSRSKEEISTSKKQSLTKADRFSRRIRPKPIIEETNFTAPNFALASSSPKCLYWFYRWLGPFQAGDADEGFRCERWGRQVWAKTERCSHSCCHASQPSSHNRLSILYVVDGCRICILTLLLQYKRSALCMTIKFNPHSTLYYRLNLLSIIVYNIFVKYVQYMSMHLNPPPTREPCCTVHDDLFQPSHYITAG